MPQYEFVSYAELVALDVPPPAMAYVRETSEYFLKFPFDPHIAKTAYYTGTWVPIDVSSPRHDRPIYKVTTQWVTTNGWTQNLDLFINEFSEGGLAQNVIDAMEASIPVPPYNITNLGTLNPGDFVLRLGFNGEGKYDPNNNQWYVATAECYDHPAPPRRRRKCWNLARITTGNAPARFDHVIHVIGKTEDEETILAQLNSRNKIIPGDIIYHKDEKSWDYMIQGTVSGLVDGDYLEGDSEINVHELTEDLLIGGTITFTGDDTQYIIIDIVDATITIAPDLVMNLANGMAFTSPKLINVDLTRAITVLREDEYHIFKQYFEFHRLYVINLTHKKQLWYRQIPVDIDQYGEILFQTWNEQQHPADFCYVE